MVAASARRRGRVGAWASQNSADSRVTQARKASCRAVVEEHIAGPIGIPGDQVSLIAPEYHVAPIIGDRRKITESGMETLCVPGPHVDEFGSAVLTITNINIEPA